MIIAVANQKGGVGKTTTVVNLSAYLAIKGKKVLIIDSDPQANATSGLGIDRHKVAKTTYDVIIKEFPLSETIIPTDVQNLDIAPANIDLVAVDLELVSVFARESRLREAIYDEVGKYDYVLIDSPPTLGLLTINAMVAADSILVPIQCEYYALEGVSLLMDTLKRLRRSLNPKVDIWRILLTMYDSRTTLSKQVAEEVRDYFPNKVFKTMIPRSVRLGEAPSFGKPIMYYAPESRGAVAYEALAEEVISSEK